MKKRILAAAALLALLCALAGCASPEEQKPQSIYPAIEWQTYGSLSLPASLPLPSFSPAGETDGVFRYSPVSEDDLQAYLDQVRQAGYQAYNAGRDFVIAGEHLGAVVSLEGSTCTIAFHPRRSSAGSGYLSQSDAIGKLNLAGAFVLIDRTTDELYSQTGMQLFWGCSQPQSAADRMQIEISCDNAIYKGKQQHAAGIGQLAFNPGNFLFNRLRPFACAAIQVGRFAEYPVDIVQQRGRVLRLGGTDGAFAAITQSKGDGIKFHNKTSFLNPARADGKPRTSSPLRRRLR